MVQKGSDPNCTNCTVFESERLLKELLHLLGVGNSIAGKGVLGALIGFPVKEGVAGSVHYMEFGSLACGFKTLHVFLHGGALYGAVLGAQHKELRCLALGGLRYVGIGSYGVLAGGIQIGHESLQALQVKHSVAGGSGLDGLGKLLAGHIRPLPPKQIVM